MARTAWSGKGNGAERKAAATTKYPSRTPPGRARSLGISIRGIRGVEITSLQAMGEAI